MKLIKKLVEKDNIEELVRFMDSCGLYELGYEIEAYKVRPCNDLFLIVEEGDLPEVGALVSLDSNNCYVLYVEVREIAQGCGVGTDFIEELVESENLTSLEGMIANNYSTFCFWDKVCKIYGTEVFVQEEDREFLNDDDYNFENEFHIDLTEVNTNK